MFSELLCFKIGWKGRVGRSWGWPPENSKTLNFSLDQNPYLIFLERLSSQTQSNHSFWCFLFCLGSIWSYLSCSVTIVNIYRALLMCQTLSAFTYVDKLEIHRWLNRLSLSQFCNYGNTVLKDTNGLAGRWNSSRLFSSQSRTLNQSFLRWL